MDSTNYEADLTVRIICLVEFLLATKKYYVAIQLATEKVQLQPNLQLIYTNQDVIERCRN
jgi:hypothetical protein